MRKERNKKIKRGRIGPFKIDKITLPSLKFYMRLAPEACAN